MKNFKAIRKTYLNTEENKTFSVWHPQVKLDGKWCFLLDESTRTKLVESKDEVDATILAINAYRNLIVPEEPK